MTAQHIPHDPLASSTRWAKHTTVALCALVAGFIGWSAMARVEEITRGEGKVVPVSRIQLVQNLEGGIVRHIGTREGAMVQAGDVIVNIDTTGAGSTLDERREKLIGLKAIIARLTAQVEGQPFSLPAEIETGRPALAREQRELYLARTREITAAWLASTCRPSNAGRRSRNSRRRFKASTVPWVLRRTSSISPSRLSSAEPPPGSS